MGGRTTQATRAAPAAPTAALSPASASGAGRVGGRFWALADSDAEDEDDAESARDSPEYSPTPSSVIWEAFDPGYSEEEVAAIVDGVVPVDDPREARTTTGRQNRGCSAHSSSPDYGCGDPALEGADTLG